MSNIFFYFFISLDILFIYFQMLSPFPVSLTTGTTLSHTPSPCFYKGVPLSTEPLPPPTLDSPILGHLSSLHRTKDLSFLLPLMPDKAILCYICSWSHVYSLFGGLVPGSSGGSGWLILFFLWGCKPLQLLQSLL